MCLKFIQTIQKQGDLCITRFQTRMKFRLGNKFLTVSWLRYDKDLLLNRRMPNICRRVGKTSQTGTHLASEPENILTD